MPKQQNLKPPPLAGSIEEKLKKGDKAVSPVPPPAPLFSPSQNWNKLVPATIGEQAPTLPALFWISNGYFGGFIH